MAESTLSLTHDAIAAEIGHVLNYGRDYTAMTTAQKAEVDALIARGMRQFYYPPPIPGERNSHSWSFLHPIGTLTTSAAYTTGTIAIASGVVTLTSGTFPSWAASGEITVSGSTYAVSTRDSATQVTLTDTSVTVSSGATYSLQRVVYDAPDNFGGFEGGMTYGTNISGSVRIPIVGEGYIRELRSLPGATTAGKPLYCAMRPKSGMLLTGQRFEFLLFPNADAAYTLTYRYSYLSDAIAATSTVYPLGGMTHSETVLASCLDIAHQYLQPRDRQREAAAREQFMLRLAASVAADRGTFQRESFGINYDRSDWAVAQVGIWHSPDTQTTYNGVGFP